jgi:glycosyltransferase involved in cell wall biosynthesis
MDIDVVIPTFNRLWALQRVVPDYLARSEVNKVIVVDDGSFDGSKEWLANLAKIEPRLLWLGHQSRRGAGAARNTGAGRTQAPYVFFADDDMLLHPEHAFTLLVKDLIEAGADIIAPVLIFPEGQQPASLPLKRIQAPPVLHLYHRLTLEMKTLRVLLGCMPDKPFLSGLTPSHMLMRRNVLEKVQYDEHLGENSYRDETDFQLTALEHGFRLFASPQAYLTDLFKPNDKGGCHSPNIVKYEWLCCRNNWRMLKRHQETLKTIGIETPKYIMQLFFIAQHIYNRLLHSMILFIRQRISIIR